jgi:hypothetical protein
MPSSLWMALFMSSTLTAFASSTISGSVRNQSRNEPAVGDEVILIRLDQEMEEEVHTRTTVQGTFSLDVQHPDKPYLVRVVHKKVNYDQRVPVGGTIAISVFDVADHISGISGTIEIFRAGTVGKSLHVSDLFEVRNASSPPLTQAGEPACEVYLPVHAKLDSVLAAGPDKIGVMISAAPVAGKPGYYAVNFPLQPGTTKFAFNYDLPYSDHAVFHTWHAYPFQQLAVMIPTTMKFSSPSSKFQILRTGASNYQVQAVGEVLAGPGPSFTVSGTGAFSPSPDQTKTKISSQLSLLPKTIMPALGQSRLDQSGLNRGVAPLSGRTNLDSDASSSWSTLQSLLAGSAFLVLCAFIVSRARRAHTNSIRRDCIPYAVRSTTLLDGLKDELFQLESDRIRGSISAEEYASARQALEQIVEHAIARRQDDSETAS